MNIWYDENKEDKGASQQWCVMKQLQTRYFMPKKKFRYQLRVIPDKNLLFVAALFVAGISPLKLFTKKCETGSIKI